MDICPVHYALTVLNGKWKLQICWVLHNKKVVRFNELRRQLDGISNLMLSQNLQALEQDRIVTRKQYNEVPPRVEYSLTELGEGIAPALELLGQWGENVYNTKHQDMKRP